MPTQLLDRAPAPSSQPATSEIPVRRLIEDETGIRRAPAAKGAPYKGEHRPPAGRLRRMAGAVIHSIKGHKGNHRAPRNYTSAPAPTPPRGAAAPGTEAWEVPVAPATEDWNVINKKASGRRNQPNAAPQPARETIGYSATGLRYQGESQRLPQRGETALTWRQPLLTREQVSAQLGFEAPGALQAVVHLPKSKEPIYCFDRSYYNEKGDRQAVYTFASTSQLGQIRSMLATGSPAWEDIRGGMLTVESGSEIAPGHAKRSIGRTRWLPGRAGDTRLDKPHAPRAYASAADRQLSVSVDPYGVLSIQDVSAELDKKTGKITPHGETATIDYNPNLIPAADPWQGQQPDMHVDTNLNHPEFALPPQPATAPHRQPPVTH